MCRDLMTTTPPMRLRNQNRRTELTARCGHPSNHCNNLTVIREYQTACQLVPARLSFLVMIHENLSAAIEDLSARMIAIRDSL